MSENAAGLPATARGITNRFAAVYEVKDGLIVSRRLYFDRMVVLGAPGDDPDGRRT